MSKTVVEQTDNGVGPLPNNHTFVNEVADLKHTKKLILLYVLLPLCCISPAEGWPHSTLQIVRTSSVSGSRSVLAVEDRWGDGPAVQSRNCSGRSLLEVECLQQLVACRGTQCEICNHLYSLLADSRATSLGWLSGGAPHRA